MKIENLENLQEINPEEFSSLQGGLSLEDWENMFNAIREQEGLNIAIPAVVNVDPRREPCYTETIPVYFTIKTVGSRFGTFILEEPRTISHRVCPVNL